MGKCKCTASSSHGKGTSSITFADLAVGEEVSSLMRVGQFASELTDAFRTVWLLRCRSLFHFRDKQ
jgi:hypothetical protein